MRSLFSLIIFLVGVTAFAGPAEYNVKCDKFAAPLSGGYCIHSPVSSYSRDIVYHLHGRGGSENDWQDVWYYPEQIRQQWKERRANAPTVVSISFGPIWLLAEKNASVNSGLFEVLTQKIIPSIESQLGGLRGRRIVVGESMGGFNTVQLALKTDLFSKAAILCAPMSEISPFDNPDVIKEHIEKSSAYAYYKNTDPNVVFNTTMGVTELAKGFYSTPEDYTRANPLLLAKNPNRTRLYVAAGYYDVYALYEGNQKFVDLLREQRRTVEWRPQWGGHCAIDIPSLASFLVN